MWENEFPSRVSFSSWLMWFSGVRAFRVPFRGRRRTRFVRGHVVGISSQLSWISRFPSYLVWPAYKVRPSEIAMGFRDKEL